ncbi:MAG TPA: ABC transporter ATP-binding protein [Clostridia bacterium]|jgi:ATP-binding cassette subfamily B protein|nr:ABC transporter ATP-binding protein [Clostridia bacterium]
MFRQFKDFKSMAWILAVIMILVTCQAVAELYLPEKMSEIINEGIYIDYEPLYKHLEMDKPSSVSGVDNEKTLKGYDKDKIPVFEMVEGFSTFDLNAAIAETLSLHRINIVFRDIPVHDSKELFEKVITPFNDGLKKYQKKGAKYDDYSTEDKAEIARIINNFIVFEPGDPRSIPIEAETGDKNTISVNDLLDRDPNADEDAMSDNANRRILTACVSCMKKSVYGNLMPIPIDKDGNRIPTDNFGQALDKSKLVYVYSNKDEEEVETAKESFTGRPDPMPDYEVIICNNVLGFAYKYHGAKWVNRDKGLSEYDAGTRAHEYNRDLLYKVLFEDNFERFAKEENMTVEEVENMLDSTYKQKIAELARIYTTDDDLILIERLFKYKNRSLKSILKAIDDTYTTNEDGDVITKIKDSKFRQFWIKLADYIKLSPTGTAKREGKVYELISKNDIMLPDGKEVQTQDLKFILTRGGLMILLTVASCVAAILAAAFSAKYASEFSAFIRARVFNKVQLFSLSEFNQFSTPSLITRSTNDVNQIQQILLLLLRTGFIAPVTLIGGFIMAAQKSLKMTSVLLYVLPILFIASFVAAKIVQPMFKIIQKRVDRLTLLTREGLTGIRVVRAFNKQETENAKFQEVNVSLTKTATTISKYNAVLSPLIAVCINCAMVGVVWIASKQIAYDEDVKVGDMMAVIQYMQQIMMALVMLATVFVMFPRATVSAARVNEVLDTAIKLKDPIEPNRRYTERGVVRFENVFYRFEDDTHTDFLKDIDFIAEKGKVTAIVGGTGSGKTTVINLIPRFFDVTKGRVVINGVDVREYPQEELRDMIGFVPQRAMLFSGTIAENLRWGKPDATEEDMWEALRIAQSEAFVKNKENGLDSEVEQGGGNFSGGQKQRLSIARAIIRKPEILIFDDSFSALDFRTDKNLRNALKGVTKDTATIIIAQRIGTIMDADLILVMDEGKIVSKGTHKELLEKCPLYKDIALSQMSAEELEL